jgi:ectoine hydroxylase-related dioxygenase (phytanoyl-CoA dioxygenase family)
LVQQRLREIPGLVASAVENIRETLQSDLIAPQLGKNVITVATMLAEEPEVVVTFGHRDWSFAFKTGELIDIWIALRSRKAS